MRFYEGGYFLRHIRKMRLLYAERQQQLLQLLQTYLKDQLRVSLSPSGMHLLCWLPEDIDMTKFKDAIQKQQLAIAYVSYFTRNTNYRRPSYSALLPIQNTR